MDTPVTFRGLARNCLLVIILGLAFGLPLSCIFYNVSVLFAAFLLAASVVFPLVMVLERWRFEVMRQYGQKYGGSFDNGSFQ